jgi:hypothetical protein
MKARTPTPLFDQALTAPLRTLTPTPLPEGEGGSGGASAPLLPRSPSRDGRSSTPYEREGGRRSRPDEGLAAIGALDWPAIERELDAYGCAIAPKLLSPETCRELAALYPDDARFRSRIVMGSHGFGKGE